MLAVVRVKHRDRKRMLRANVTLPGRSHDRIAKAPLNRSRSIRLVLKAALRSLACAAILAPAMAHAERPVRPPATRSAPAPPRALTSQQLSERGLLGRFQGLDPELYGRIWRVGRDPRTCRSAQFLAITYRSSLDRLTAAMNANAARDGLRESETLKYELAIADSLEFTGRYGEVERFLKQRIATRLTHASGSEAASRLEDLQERLARLYTSTRPDEAERILQQIAKSRVAANQALFVGQTHGYPVGSPPWLYWKRQVEQFSTANVQRVLGPFYQSSGRLSEALAVEQAALAPLEREAADTRPGNGPPAGLAELRVRVATTKAALAEKAGRLAEAEVLYRACCEASPELARLLLREGKREEARVVLAQMMVQVGADIEEVFDCMRTPGEGDLAQAIPRAQASARRWWQDPSVTVVNEDGAGGGGDEAYRASRVSAAADDLRRATELGELLLQAGLAADARDVLFPTTGLQQVVLGGSHPDALRSLAALGRAVRQLGRPEVAVGVWKDWQALGGEFLTSRLWSVNEDQRRGFFRDDRQNVDQYLAAVRDAAPADAAMQVLAISLRHKGLLASVAGDIGVRAQGRADGQTPGLLAQLRQLRAQFSALALRDKAGSPEARLLRRRIDDVEAQLAASLGKSAGPGLAPDPQAVLARLLPGEVLVDFLVFRDVDAPEGADRERMVAVVARAGAAPDLVWWTDVSPVRGAASRFRRAMLLDPADAARASQLQAAGRDLYDLLWKPLAGRVGAASRVLLGPDDVLDVAPLAALPDETGRTLLERYELVTLTGPRELLEPPSTARSKTALVVGAPAFGAAAGGAADARSAGRVIGARSDQIFFAPLPGTLSEGEGVNSLLAGSYASRFLAGPAATKAAVTATRSPAVLHLATHGFFLIGLAGSAEEGDPLVSLSRSGLAFANANLGLRTPSASGGTEGILTGLEALSLDLRGTQLVVLSACETALGQVASGEGVYGLAQALHQAGAQTVMATLWPVSDEATSAFMQRFYAALAKGATPQQALRSTQLAFAQSGPWRDPIYWAPFVLTGH